MRWHGRADVLYQVSTCLWIDMHVFVHVFVSWLLCTSLQAMKPLLYVSSSDVVHALFPCLLLLLPVIDYCPSPPIPAKVSSLCDACINRYVNSSRN